MEKVEDTLHRERVIGTCHGSIQVQNGKYLSGMRKEITAVYLQRAIISYLETLSDPPLDRQDSSLTWMMCASSNRHAFMYPTSPNLLCVNPNFMAAPISFLKKFQPYRLLICDMLPYQSLRWHHVSCKAIQDITQIHYAHTFKMHVITMLTIFICLSMEVYMLGFFFYYPMFPLHKMNQ